MSDLISRQEAIDLKWIPVSERLPENHARILVTIARSDGQMRVRSGCYYDDYFSIDNGDIWYVRDDGITAWMPLPEPRGGE